MDSRRGGAVAPRTRLGKEGADDAPMRQRRRSECSAPSAEGQPASPRHERSGDAAPRATETRFRPFAFERYRASSARENSAV